MLTRFAMLGVDLCRDEFLNFLNSKHLSLSGTDSCFATLARLGHADTIAMLGTDLFSVVFLSYLSFRHQLAFSMLPWFFMRTRFAMFDKERFAMLGRDLLGVDLCSAVFLNILKSNHLSLSGTDSRFATLARFLSC